MNNRDDILLFIVFVSLVITSFALLSLVFHYENQIRIDNASKFCNSIGMQYDDLDNSRVCYTDDGDTRYIINIIYADGKYRLLKSGERYR